MQIGKQDIFWNYAAIVLKIGSSALLIPLILAMMPSDVVGIWTIFMTITSLTNLFDFGFNPSFTRNISYIYSGVRVLKVQGFESVTDPNQSTDYGLLKGVISAMRWLYLRIAIILFFLLGILGTWYIYDLLKQYHGNHQEVYIVWSLLCIINTYNIYTLYYDSLLQGKGLVKRAKQIVIIGQVVYLIISSCMIMFGCGLIAIVSAQICSVIIIRWMSYNSYFTREIKQILQSVKAVPQKQILEVIYPNAIKIGLTSLGGFMVQRSAIIIGSLYLSLKEIASYGITMQLITIIAGLAGIYTATYQPRIARLRVEGKNMVVKELYLKGQIIQIATYILGGLSILFLGNWAFTLIGSHTKLMPTIMLTIALIISFLENNHSVAGGILLTNNIVPFFKASITAGVFTIFLLIVMFNFANLSLWTMILAPGIAHLYNNWRWPYEVYKQLNISKKDIFKTLINIGKFHTHGK